MRNKYPDVTAEQLAELNDDCAICREPMETAKKLPCEHVFHENCLRLWLEHHHSCPTCRHQLIGNNEPVPDENNGNEGQPRFAWVRRLFRRRQTVVTPEMIAAVREVAPHIPEAWIVRDLERTGSPQLTLERVFEQFPIPEVNEEEAAAREIVVASPAPIQDRTDRADRIDSVSSVLNEIQKLEESVQAGFGNSQAEREKVLRDRKELMLKKGKLNFLRRQESSRSFSMPIEVEPTPPPPGNHVPEKEEKMEAPEHVGATGEEVREGVGGIENIEEIPSFSLQDSVAMRRKRALVAAERRRRLSKNFQDESAP
eukprot:CAMPEP_0117017284 /NCGR_PEP_ID=MMETSP0472-20121206/13520_1 /TAXON_ID=693140 ORGANISM="Tiarina fusus, Strain LIS" /NCGR_SAMPLE_ID=MMETSP0472 /ASSEMBLY_ACC=CAM_ASM_000603 /LENGTH=312 /DNA_ID=CAMNT_0004721611 /DNA_START=860 /DNA_END=1794 /DNA_ORIENTATION=+